MVALQCCGRITGLVQSLALTKPKSNSTRVYIRIIFNSNVFVLRTEQASVVACGQNAGAVVDERLAR